MAVANTARNRPGRWSAGPAAASAATPWSERQVATIRESSSPAARSRRWVVPQSQLMNSLGIRDRQVEIGGRRCRYPTGAWATMLPKRRGATQVSCFAESRHWEGVSTGFAAASTKL